MKKLFFSLVIAAVAAVGMMSCGGGVTKLEGETVETEYFSIIVPQTWEQNKYNTDKNFRIEKKLEDGSWCTMTLYPYPDRTSEPAEANSGNVNAGYTDKGDMKFGNLTYNVAIKEAEKPTSNLYTKLTEKGLLLVSLYNGSIDDPEVKAIIENISLK